MGKAFTALKALPERVVQVVWEDQAALVGPGVQAAPVGPEDRAARVVPEDRAAPGVPGVPEEDRAVPVVQAARAVPVVPGGPVEDRVDPAAPGGPVEDRVEDRVDPAGTSDPEVGSCRIIPDGLSRMLNGVRGFYLLISLSPSHPLSGAPYPLLIPPSEVPRRKNILARPPPEGLLRPPSP